MEQLELRLLGRLDAPSIVPPHAIAACKTGNATAEGCSMKQLASKVQIKYAKRGGV